MHAKLDELLRAEKFARKELAGIEELESEEIAALKLKLAVSPVDSPDSIDGTAAPVDTPMSGTADSNPVRRPQRRNLARTQSARP